MRVPNYVSSVTRIVTEYGFDGIDLDFESPSLSIEPGDTDFKHPTTPSIVNLILALHQLHDHFSRDFMISLVPEGTQIPAGFLAINCKTRGRWFLTGTAHVREGTAPCSLLKSL